MSMRVWFGRWWWLGAVAVERRLSFSDVNMGIGFLWYGICVWFMAFVRLVSETAFEVGEEVAFGEKP